MNFGIIAILGIVFIVLIVVFIVSGDSKPKKKDQDDWKKHL